MGSSTRGAVLCPCFELIPCSRCVVLWRNKWAIQKAAPGAPAQSLLELGSAVHPSHTAEAQHPLRRCIIERCLGCTLRAAARSGPSRQDSASAHTSPTNGHSLGACKPSTQLKVCCVRWGAPDQAAAWPAGQCSRVGHRRAGGYCCALWCSQARCCTHRLPAREPVISAGPLQGRCAGRNAQPCCCRLRRFTRLTKQSTRRTRRG